MNPASRRPATDDTSTDTSSFQTALEHERFDPDALSDEDLAQLLFEDDDAAQDGGVWNLPTLAGLALILVGAVYLFQEMGLWSGFDVSELIEMLPWMAGILIILLGFGVLSWRPRRKKKVRKKTRKSATASSDKKKVVVEEADGKKQFHRSSRNKKIAGVCGGLGDYFNIDPTLIRIGFVAGLFFTDGMIILAYAVLAYVLPKDEAEATDAATLSAEERLRIIRES